MSDTAITSVPAQASQATSPVAFETIHETLSHEFMTAAPRQPVWRVEFNMTTGQITLAGREAITPSTCQRASREEFPVIYIGEQTSHADDHCESILDAEIWCQYINDRIVADLGTKMIHMSAYQLESWLNWHFRFRGLWSSRRKPLEAMEMAGAKTRHPTGRKRSVRKHQTANEVERAESSKGARRHLDEKESHHNPAGKPRQETPETPSRSLENNWVASSDTTSLAATLDIDMDATLAALQKAGKSKQAEAMIRIAEMAGVSHSPNVSSVTEQLIEIGTATSDQARIFCEWCRERHGIRLHSQVNHDGTELIRRPPVNASVAKSIAAKFHWDTQGGKKKGGKQKMAGSAGFASVYTEAKRVLVEGEPGALACSFQWKAPGDVPSDWLVQLSPPAETEGKHGSPRTSFLYRKLTGTENEGAIDHKWGDATMAILEPTIAPSFKEALKESIVFLSNLHRDQKAARAKQERLERASERAAEKASEPQNTGQNADKISEYELPKSKGNAGAIAVAFEFEISKESTVKCIVVRRKGRFAYNFEDEMRSGAPWMRLDKVIGNNAYSSKFRMGLTAAKSRIRHIEMERDEAAKPVAHSSIDPAAAIASLYGEYVITTPQIDMPDVVE